MWLLIVSVLVAFPGTGGTSPCVEITPPEAVVRFEDPLMANCSSFSKQVQGMGWESTYGGVSLTPGVNSLQLNLSSVKVWELQPTCFMTFLNGSQCEKKLPVTIYKRPDSLLLSLPKEKEIIEGKTYHFECDIVNVAPLRNLTVYYRNGKQRVFLRTFDDITTKPVNKSVSFDLEADRSDNGNSIICETELNFLPDLGYLSSSPHKLNVLYPPTFIQPADKVLDIPADRKIILNCTAAGNPVPVYTWQFLNPGTFLKENLTINEPVYNSDNPLQGTYSCIASNSRGTKTKNFTVNAAGDRTTFAALVGVFVTLGILLIIAGFYFVTPEGYFTCSKGSYMPAQSGPV